MYTDLVNRSFPVAFFVSILYCYYPYVFVGTNPTKYIFVLWPVAPTGPPATGTKPYLPYVWPFVPG